MKRSVATTSRGRRPVFLLLFLSLFLLCDVALAFLPFLPRPTTIHRSTASSSSSSDDNEQPPRRRPPPRSSQKKLPPSTAAIPPKRQPRGGAGGGDAWYIGMANTTNASRPTTPGRPPFQNPRQEQQHSYGQRGGEGAARPSPSHHKPHHQYVQHPTTQGKGGGGSTTNVSPLNIEINKELLRRGEDPQALLAYAINMLDQLNTVNIATVLNRLSKTHTRDSLLLHDARFHQLTTKTQAMLPQCQAAELSIILNGISKLGHDPGPDFWTQSRDLSIQLLPTFNHNAHFVNLLNAYGRQRFHPGPTWFSAFLAASEPYLPTLNARELASLLNSFANLRVSIPSGYMEKLRDGVLGRVGEMYPREMATVVNGFGRAARPESGGMGRGGGGWNKSNRKQHQQQQEEVEVVEEGRAEKEKPFHPGMTVLDALAKASESKLGMFDPQGLASLINGFAHMDYRPSEKWTRAYVQAMDHAMPRFNSQDFGIIVNGLAALSLCPETYKLGILPRLRDLAAPKLERFNDQELANLINALGKWDFNPGESFLSSFAAACLVPARLSVFTPQGLANVLHALGRLGFYPGEKWMDGVLNRCLEVMDGFSAQGLAMVVLGLSNMRYYPGQAFLDAVTQAAVQQAGSFDQQYLANFWLGCANLGYQPPSSFWAACRTQIPWEHMLARLTLFEASTLLYSLAVMDGTSSRGFMGPLVVRACRMLSQQSETKKKKQQQQQEGEEEEEEMDLEQESALRQLHQTFLYLECLRRQGDVEKKEEERKQYITPGVTYELLRDFGSLIGKAWDESSHLLSLRIRTSSFQTDVQETAEALGLCCLPEARDGPFTLDMVIVPSPPSSSSKPQETVEVLPIVLEVDGPTHYFVNEPATMTGTSRIKHHLLAAQGHRWAAVVSISLHEWTTAGYSPKKKKAILEAKLKDAGISSLVPYAFTNGEKGQRECALLDGTHHSPYVRLENDNGEEEQEDERKR